MTSRPDPDAFETFYKDVRGRLLLQTWALTGDLPAAQKAVRDALVHSWHHWRKVGRLADPESYVRPQAWTHALRRHTARPFHREKDASDEVRQTLAALAKLPLVQRKVLLLVFMTRLPLDQVARELGLTQARVERELQTATAAFSLQRDVESTSIRTLFEPMAATVASVRWPRPSIITRAGTARRRAHSALSALAVVAVLAGTGFAVSDSGGAEPRLDGLRLSTPEPTVPPAPPPELAPTDLLAPEQVTARIAGNWTVDLTSDNAGGDGLLLPCQRRRYADKAVETALIRTFVGKPARTSVGQAAEVSASEQSAQAAYTAALEWYAGCRESRFQLLSTQEVSAVGDEAAMVILRDWNPPAHSIAVGVARSGQLTTTVAATLPPGKLKDVDSFAELLADAVNGICALPDAGTCASSPKRQEVPPLPLGRHPGLLNEIDLPPVSGVDKPWMGTRPAAPQNNLAATRCDNSTFQGPAVASARTRSFVIPTARRLPPEFGLTETVGRFKNQVAATRFVADVRRKLATCSDRDLTSQVAQTETSTSKRLDLTSWRVTVEIADDRTVVYQMAILRNGANVAQLGFVPSGSVQMTPEAFSALTQRAQQRLAQLS